MILRINGTDVTPYIAFQGVKFTRYDVDGPNAGRTLSGKMIRDRVATKAKLEVTCRPLKADELSTVLTLIQPVSVNVTYTNPITNSEVTAEMYSNNIPATYCMRRADGEWWMGVAFPLVEI